MSPLVNVTPSTDGEAALSQIATAKLRFGLDVAFCGGHPDYWAALRFYDWLGLLGDPVVRADLSRMRDEAISDSLAHGTVLDRLHDDNNPVTQDIIKMDETAEEPTEDGGRGKESKDDQGRSHGRPGGTHDAPDLIPENITEDQDGGDKNQPKTGSKQGIGQGLAEGRGGRTDIRPSDPGRINRSAGHLQPFHDALWISGPIPRRPDRPRGYTR